MKRFQPRPQPHQARPWVLARQKEEVKKAQRLPQTSHLQHKLRLTIQVVSTTL